MENIQSHAIDFSEVAKKIGTSIENGLTEQEAQNRLEQYGKNELVSIDRQELENRLAKLAGPHALCWAQPGYRDSGIIV